MVGHVPDRKKPQTKRFACSLKQCARCYGRFVMARLAVIKIPSRFPVCIAAAARTLIPVPPTDKAQILKAGLFRRKHIHKIHHVRRITLHHSKRYI